MGNDKVKADIRVRFYEDTITNLRVGTDWAGQMLSHEQKGEEKPIRGKWLYVFYSEGFDYQIDPQGGKNPVYLTRIKESVWGGQHIARLWKDRKNHADPNDKADHVLYEIQFDEDGKFYYRDISSASLWNISRHKRKTPETWWKERKRTPVDSLPLSLMIRGKDVRYYFLLSSIRLGRNGFKAAMEKGGTAGLSIWAYCARNGFPKGYKKPDVAWAPTADDIRKLRKDQDPRLAGLRAIGVIDPYELATYISEEFYDKALVNTTLLMERISTGKRVAGDVDQKRPCLQNPHEIGGTLSDAYLIAKVLLGYETHFKTINKGKDPYDGKFDHDRANAVVDFIEHKMNYARNATEACALFLCKWVSSTAHRLVDIAATRDTNDDPQSMTAADMEMASGDRAYSLLHWSNLTTLLGLSARGALFVGDIEKECPDNPVGKILLPYKDKKLPDGDSLDFKTFCKASIVIPDLALNWIGNNCNDAGFQGTDRYKRFARKAKDLVDLMNNIRYFNHRLEIPKSTKDLEIPTAAYAIAKPWIDNGVAIAIVTPDKLINSILDDFWQNPKHSEFAAKAARWMSKTGPWPIRTLHNRLTKGKVGIGVAMMDAAERTGKASSYIKVFTAFANILFGQGEYIQRVFDEKQGKWKKYEAGMDIAMAGAGIFEASCAISGIKEVTIREIVVAGQADGAKGVLGKLASRGTALTVVGIVGGAWNIYSCSRDALKAWDSGDYSSIAGQGIAVFGGLVLLVHGFASLFGAAALFGLSLGVVGLVGILILLIGTLIAAIFMDTDWEKFVFHCVFSNDASRRLTRRFGEEDEWAGKPVEIAGKHEHFWPVSHQRVALLNMISKVVMRSRATVHDVDTKFVKCTVTRVEFTLEFQYIPSESFIEVEIKGGVGPWDMRTRHLRVTLYPPRRERIHWKLEGGSPKEVSWKLEFSAQNLPYSTTVGLTLTGARIQCEQLEAQMGLSLGGRGMISGNHLLFWFSPPVMKEGQWGDPEWYFRNNTQPSVAGKYAGITMPPMKGLYL